MITNLQYTWGEFDTDIVRLCDKLEIHKFDYIIAISRGGNVLGTVLSHKLKTPLKIYDPKTQDLNDLKINFSISRILVVDDINDTGETINSFRRCVIKTLKGKCEEGWENILSLDNIKFCALFNAYKSKSTIDFWVHKIDNTDLWVNFCWE